MLHFRSVGEGRPVVIVHGLFGSGDNWTTLAGHLPGCQVFLPDLRNHGRSPHRDEFTLAHLAADLASWSAAQNLGPCPWIGHSLGGKTVLELALTRPDLVTGIAVLDMAPKASTVRYEGFVPALRALDLGSLSSRSEAQERLKAAVPDPATLQFLLKSLVPDETRPGCWRWRLNLESLDRNYAEIWKPVVRGRSWPGPALFLYGAVSDYVAPADEALIREFCPGARLEAIAGAGHWLHADKPVEVMGALHRWLKEVP
jgi:pimeloyl-ACP methyl ester carboxylesterase